MDIDSELQPPSTAADMESGASEADHQIISPKDIDEDLSDYESSSEDEDDEDGDEEEDEDEDEDEEDENEEDEEDEDMPSAPRTAALGDAIRSPMSSEAPSTQRSSAVPEPQSEDTNESSKAAAAWPERVAPMAAERMDKV